MAQQKEDWFICPNCGAEVKMSAKICEECGADDETGWNPDAVQGWTFIEHEADFDYEETLARETGQSKTQVWKIAGAVILLIAMLAYLFSGIFR